MEAAGGVVLYEGRNRELIGLDHFMPRADFLAVRVASSSSNGGRR